MGGSGYIRGKSCCGLSEAETGAQVMTLFFPSKKKGKIKTKIVRIKGLTLQLLVVR